MKKNYSNKYLSNFLLKQEDWINTKSEHNYCTIRTFYLFSKRFCIYLKKNKLLERGKRSQLFDPTLQTKQ